MKQTVFLTLGWANDRTSTILTPSWNICSIWNNCQVIRYNSSSSPDVWFSHLISVWTQSSARCEQFQLSVWLYAQTLLRLTVWWSWLQSTNKQQPAVQNHFKVCFTHTQKTAHYTIFLLFSVKMNSRPITAVIWRSSFQFHAFLMTHLLWCPLVLPSGGE